MLLVCCCYVTGKTHPNNPCPSADGTLSLMGVLWYFKFVPETKGKTLEEITATFREDDEYNSGRACGRLTGSSNQTTSPIYKFELSSRRAEIEK